MAADFGIAAGQEAPAKHGKPEIVNTDQGRQIPGATFTGMLRQSGIAISHGTAIGGKGANSRPDLA